MTPMDTMPVPNHRDVRRFVAERGRHAGLPLPGVLVEVVNALADWRPEAPLRYAGIPPRRIDVDGASFAGYLSEVEAVRAAGEPRIWVLSSGGAEPEFSLFLDIDSRAVGGSERIWFPLPPAKGPALAADRLSDLAARVCGAFGAWQGRIEDEFLLMYYRGRTSAARVREIVPPELRAYVPDLSPPPPDALPELLLPTDFDTRRVPDAVWWLNYWDHVQVETLGLDRVREAGFHRLVELPGGAVVAVVDPSPLQPDSRAQLLKLRDIVERLGLRELQEAHRRRTGTG